MNPDPPTRESGFNTKMRWATLLILVLPWTAAADSKPAPPKTASTAPPPTSSDPTPLTRTPSVQPFLVFDPPPPPVKSLRLEALRIAGERSDSDWRYPEPEPIAGF